MLRLNWSFCMEHLAKLSLVIITAVSLRHTKTRRFMWCARRLLDHSVLHFSSLALCSIHFLSCLLKLVLISKFPGWQSVIQHCSIIRVVIFCLMTSLRKDSCCCLTWTSTSVQTTSNCLPASVLKKSRKLETVESRMLPLTLIVLASSRCSTWTMQQVQT